MVMRGDNIRQRSHLMCTASYISVYTQRDIAVHANDNCEHISSMVGRTWDEGSYAYTYDALNRLESAVFSSIAPTAKNTTTYPPTYSAQPIPYAT